MHSIARMLPFRCARNHARLCALRRLRLVLVAVVVLVVLMVLAAAGGGACCPLATPSRTHQAHIHTRYHALFVPRKARF